MVPRPRIDRLLAGAWERRITLVLAGGGYGKTTALRGLAGDRASLLALRAADREVETLAVRIAQALGAGSHPGVAAPTSGIGASDRQALAEGQAAAICESLDARQTERMLILDDIDQLRDEDSGIPFLRALCSQAPPHLHLVLGGRRLPSLRLGAARGRGELLEVEARDLAFTPDETEALLESRLGAAGQAIAGDCWSLTGGWAAALQLIVDRLERLKPSQREGVLDQLRARLAQPWREFGEELVEDESAAARQILAIASITPVVDRALLAGLGVDRAAEELESLHARGLLVLSGERGELALSPVLSEVVAGSLPGAEGADLRRRAALWFERAGRLEEALECALAGPAGSGRDLLRRCGGRLVARGHGARVAIVLRELGTADDLQLQTLLGEALVASGEWDGAMELFQTIRAGSAGAPLPTATAWRFGALLYLRGETDLAFDVLSDVPADGAGSRDEALVSAWLGATLWGRGEVEEADRAASRALRQAEASGDHLAIATAHATMAMVTASLGERERNERHSRAALKAALKAGDPGTLARIHANLSSKALEEGDLRRCVEEADAALGAGAGHNLFGALAMSNKAQALMHAGELEEARALLMHSIEMFSSLGSRLACVPSVVMAQLDAVRGDLVRARMSFERTRRLAEDADDAHTLAQALSGLVRALGPDDPDAARDYAREAVARATTLERAEALTASAWAELCAGDRDAALRVAAEAEALARRTDDRPSLARALELLGAAPDPPAGQLLEAAADLWREVGDPIATRRAELALAACRGDWKRLDELRAELAGFGVKPELGVAELLLRARRGSSGIAITTLGRFSVTRAGEPIPLAAWQSRKARDLLKLLAARRGRPVTRDGAAELLWPNEPPGPLPNRLSVALSTLRKVLDPDRSHPPDRYIAADAQSLSLRTEHVELDVARFLDCAEESIELASRGDWEAARRLLVEAESLYTGEFLEEDQYQDWSIDCREETRSAAQEVSRLLARAASRRGDEEEATRHLRRLLERDPYDGDAWTALLGSQLRLRRFGEARRQHAAYARRMTELAIAAIPLTQTADRRP